MRKVSRRVGAAVVLLAAAVTAVGLGGAAGAKPASGEPIKIGFVAAFPAGASPATTAQGLQAYLDDWNKRGGFNGQPIDVIQVDPKSFSASSYVDAVNGLINDEHVVALISIGNCQATLPVVRAAGIPVWGATAAPPCGLDEDGVFAQLGGFAGTAPVNPAFKYAIDHGSKKFGLMYPTAVAALKSAALDPLNNYLKHHPEVKTEVVPVSLPISPTAADVDGTIANMKEEGVDSVFSFIQAADVPLVLDEAKTQGFGPGDGIDYYLGSNLHTSEVASLPDAEGVYLMDTAYPVEDTKNPEVKKANKVLKGKVDAIDGFAQSGYQVAGFLENSMKGLKGKVTSASLLAHWKKVGKVPFPLSPAKLSMTNPNHPAGGFPLQLKDGKFVPVGEFIIIPYKDLAP